jgi:hypothetical protein
MIGPARPVRISTAPGNALELSARHRAALRRNPLPPLDLRGCFLPFAPPQRSVFRAFFATIPESMMNLLRFYSNSSRLLVLAVIVFAQNGCSSTGDDDDASSSHFISNLEPGRPITAHTVGRDPVEVNQPSRSDAASSRPPRSEPRLRPVDPPASSSGAGNRAPVSSSFEEDEAAILAELDQDLATPGSTAGSASLQGDDTWAILLRSVATENHAQDAQQVQQIFARACPELRGMWIHSTEIGSKVLYGRFSSVDDAAATQALQWVKTLRATNGATPFHAAMLVRIEGTGPGVAGDRIHPYDLRTLRRAYPRVNPLYSMQVAAWVGPDDNESAWLECRRQAEQYAASLRAQGHEAWFYHDDTARISSVTVGKFDRRIINQTSGLYTLDVERMYEKFPVHLTNGEEMLVHADSNNPNSPLVPQQPRLVEVPKDLE